MNDFKGAEKAALRQRFDKLKAACFYVSTGLDHQIKKNS